MYILVGRSIEYDKDRSGEYYTIQLFKPRAPDDRITNYINISQTAYNY